LDDRVKALYNSEKTCGPGYFFFLIYYDTKNLPYVLKNSSCCVIIFHDLNIDSPLMYSGMTKNSNFITEVSQHFRKDDEIIVVSAYVLKALVEWLSSMLFLALCLIQILTCGSTGVPAW